MHRLEQAAQAQRDRDNERAARTTRQRELARQPNFADTITDEYMTRMPEGWPSGNLPVLWVKPDGSIAFWDLQLSHLLSIIRYLWRKKEEDFERYQRVARSNNRAVIQTFLQHACVGRPITPADTAVTYLESRKSFQAACYEATRRNRDPLEDCNYEPSDAVKQSWPFWLPQTYNYPKAEIPNGVVVPGDPDDFPF